MKQEQMRLTKLQVILEEDRRALIEQARKERIELQQLIVREWKLRNCLASKLSNAYFFA